MQTLICLVFFCKKIVNFIGSEYSILNVSSRLSVVDPLSTKSGSGFLDLWIRIQPEDDEIFEDLRNLNFFLTKNVR